MKQQIQIASLEANIFWDEIRDAYRSSSLHGNTEVLQLLVSIQCNLERSIGDREEHYEEAHNQGSQEGYSAAMNNHFEPINSAAMALIACIEDLKAALSDMEDDYNK